MFDGIINAIQSAVFWLLLSIDAIVYSFINWVYQVILILAQGDILKDSTIVDQLVNRIYVIIGVIVLFLVAYSLLKSMVNPDDALKGKESPVKIIQNVIISVVLIAIVPQIFSFAMAFQNSILINNTLGKIILGTGTTINDSVTLDSNTAIANGGMTMATTVFKAFFTPNQDTSNNYCIGDAYLDSDGCTQVQINGTDYDDWWQEIIDSHNIMRINEANDEVAEGDISYRFIISTVAGIFVLFVLVSYCIDLAIRMVKLAFYQLIAPLPILMRIVPKDDVKKIFDNWVKATLSTYLEVFIRLGILYFSVLIINVFVTNLGTIFSTTLDNWGSANPIIILIAQALVILGIILFMKQAPQIIKDVTGLDSGKYGKSLIRGIGMMGATFGGGATAAIRSVVNDKDKPLPQRLGRGALAGLSGSARGLRNGTKVEKFGDIPKSAGSAASATLGHRADMDAAIATAGGKRLKGMQEYYKQKGKNVIDNASNWVIGSFDAQQKMLEQVNEFLKDAKAVKSTTEGLVRDKKYLFSIVGKGESPIIKKNAAGEDVILDENTSLSAVDSIIQSLKATGNIEDAKLADEINNTMQQRIKKIGQGLAAASVDNSKIPKFNDDFMMEGKNIQAEAMPTLATAASQYTIVQQKYARNSSLDAVIKFQVDEHGNHRDLQPDNVSKLADALETQAAEISQNIKVEQERRKAANPKGGKDK